MVRESRVVVARPTYLSEGQVIVARTSYTAHTRLRHKCGKRGKIRGLLISVCTAPLNLLGLGFCRRKMDRERCYPLTELYNNAYNEILCREPTVGDVPMLPSNQ
jgi:hypothetical protein